VFSLLAAGVGETGGAGSDDAVGGGDRECRPGDVLGGDALEEEGLECGGDVFGSVRGLLGSCRLAAERQRGGAKHVTQGTRSYP
jgi:hypothetical protein